MIKFSCTHCGQRLNSPNNYANKRIRCPKCKNAIQVPAQFQPSKTTSQSIIKFRCPTCNQKIGVSIKYAGKRVRCAKCKNPLQVPTAKQPEMHSQSATAAAIETSAQDDINFDNVFDDNATQQLLAAEANAPEVETLRLKPIEPQTSSGWAAESQFYAKAAPYRTESEPGAVSSILHSAYKIPIALAASIGFTVGAAIIWTILAYFIGLSWLHFLCIPVATAAGYGLTVFTERRGAMLGLLAALIGLFGIFCGKLFLAKWVVLPKMENPFAIATEEFEKAALNEEQIRYRLEDPNLMFEAACYQLADNNEFDQEFAKKVVQTHFDGRAPIGQVEQITQGIQKVETALDTWSLEQKRQAIIAQYEREKKVFKEFGRSILTAVTEANETKVPEGVRKTAQETQELFDGTRPIQQTKIGFIMAFIGSFSLLDLLFIPMGLWGAYKVGAGKQ